MNKSERVTRSGSKSYGERIQSHIKEDNPSKNRLSPCKKKKAGSKIKECSSKIEENLAYKAKLRSYTKKDLNKSNM